MLADNKLKFRKDQSEEKHRFIVVNTPFAAYTIPKKATLAGRGTSLQSQNALIKVLMELGVLDKDKGEQVLARNRSLPLIIALPSHDGTILLILDYRGGKFGPNACLPIEVNGQTCNGALAIGRFAALSCTSGTQIYMFKARNQTDFGHILCKNCHSSCPRH